MPGFNINEFKSQLNDRNGLMRSNRFLVTMTPPAVMNGGIEEFRSFEFWCESVTLPGYMISSYSNKRYTYGPDEKRPAIPVYQPIQCVFNSDGKGSYLQFFNKWLQYIMPHDWYNSFNQRSLYNGSMYELEYKSNYATDINILVYDMSGNVSLQYVIKEAFPAQIYDIPFNWADNQNTKFQVNFEYVDWILYNEIRDTAPDNPNTATPPLNPPKPREPVPPIGNPAGDPWGN